MWEKQELQLSEGSQLQANREEDPGQDPVSEYLRQPDQGTPSVLIFTTAILHINHIKFKLYIKFLNGNFSVLTFIKCSNFIMEIFNWRPLIYMSLSLIYNPSIIKLLKNEGEQTF